MKTRYCFYAYKIILISEPHNPHRSQSTCRGGVYKAWSSTEYLNIYI